MMRVSGLATGMDTESIIRDMMQAQRLPLDKITQKKQYLEWQLDDYRSVNRKLFDFSQNTFNNVILSNTFTAKTVSVSAPDDVAIRNINASSDFSGTIQIHQLAKNATLQSGKLDETVTSSTKLEDLPGFNGERIIKIQAIDKEGKLGEMKELKFNATDTLDSILKRINSETDVDAFFDEFTGRIAMTAKNSGKIEGNESQEIVIAGKLANVLGLDEGSATMNEGQNSIITFNGLRTQRTSNTFQINGFEVALKQVTAPLSDVDNWESEVEGTGRVVTFSSAADTDKILDTVVKFVDEYNKLIEDLNAQIREPRYRNFHPLSTEQKAEMKEKEIELWEEKAMSGTLRNDPIISSMLSKMRSSLMGEVKGVGTLQDIGITTSIDYLDHGKLVIDEDTLREAINADPSKVHKLFSQSSETADEKGFARRLREAVDATQTQISTRAGKANSVNDTFTLGRNLNEMDKQIERFQARLEMTENRLWKQFTAMEMAIQRANAQSAQLMGAFGGMM